MSGEDGQGSVEPVNPPVAEALGLTPPEAVAASALNRARAAARTRGRSPIRPGVGRGTRRDGRDPVLIGETLARLAAERGWTSELSVGGVLGRWSELVGEQMADHCQPEAFSEGVLVLRADSTSWATQVRLLSPQLLSRVAQEVGPEVVREIRVLGPRSPNWVKGPRSVPGRGPRDTYG